MSVNDEPPSVPACALCARPGDFGRLTASDALSGLCPDCIAARRPAREGLEQAVVLVARMELESAERLSLSLATPDELTFHVAALCRGLRSMLHLFNEHVPPNLAGPASRGAAVPHRSTACLHVVHLCGNCRRNTDQPRIVRVTEPDSEAACGLVVCPSCADQLGGDVR